MKGALLLYAPMKLSAGFLLPLFMWLPVSGLCDGQEYPFAKGRNDAQIMERLSGGGISLIGKYGDLLFDHLRYLPIYLPPAPHDPSDMHVPGFRKDDYPVASLLITGGDQTVHLFETTAFFEIAVPDGELEMISFVLFRILGRQRAEEFAQQRQLSGDEAEKRNWLRIHQLLEDPRNERGLFFVTPREDDEKVAASREIYLAYYKERRAWRERRAEEAPDSR